MTVIVKAADLISKWQYALDNRWGYIWGKYGQVWTQANQNAATEAGIRQYGQQWVGHHVADCSGLGYWAFKELGGYIFHGSNTIWRQYVTDRSTLKFGVRTDGKPMLPGDPVFKTRTENGAVNRHHIGYFVGGDTVIEAKGTISGVVTSKVSEWHETAHWLNVEYENGVIYMSKPTLKKGDKGTDVVTMQSLLVRSGYALPAVKSAPDGIDGIFGANTEAVLKQFQADHSLTADGMCGDQTWTALEKAAGNTASDTSAATDDKVLTKAEAQELLNMLDAAKNFLSSRM